jgi:hypothetical protein
MSDHFSGPRALAGPAGDISDMYAFPSPERPGHLVLVMTVLPNAGPDAIFSDAIVCRFRLRPLTIDAEHRAFSFGSDESELVFSWTFEAPQADASGATPRQDGWCTSPFAEPARVRVHDERGGHGTDWPLGLDGAHPLTEDAAQRLHGGGRLHAVRQRGYFEIERAVLDGHAHETLGGRSINHNVMNTIYSLLINGGHGPRISGGVDQATVPASDVFPYLAAPNPDSSTGLQAVIQRLLG